MKNKKEEYLENKIEFLRKRLKKKVGLEYKTTDEVLN